MDVVTDSHLHYRALGDSHNIFTLRLETLRGLCDKFFQYRTLVGTAHRRCVRRSHRQRSPHFIVAGARTVGRHAGPTFSQIDTSLGILHIQDLSLFNAAAGKFRCEAIMAATDLRGATPSAGNPSAVADPNPGRSGKTEVRAATTGSTIALSGLITLDGEALAEGDRVLVKDQTVAAANGIYGASAGNWTRVADFADNSTIAAGLRITVRAGVLNRLTEWTLNAANPIVLGTTPLIFTLRPISQDPLAPWAPQLHQNAGGTNYGHMLCWADQNFDLALDRFCIQSGDQSMIIGITIGGSPAAGDTVTANVRLAGVTYPVVYTVQPGETILTVATAFAAALNGGTSHATGGPEFVAAMAAFTGADGIGYLPCASAAGTVVSLDVPWGTDNGITTAATGGVTATPDANNVTDNGPILILARQIKGRMPVPRDQYGVIQYQFASGTSGYDSSALIGLQYAGGTTGSPYTRFYIAPCSGGPIGRIVTWIGPGGLSLGDIDGSGNPVNAFTGTHAHGDPGPGSFSAPGRIIAGVSGTSGVDPTTIAMIESFGTVRVRNNTNTPKVGSGLELQYNAAGSAASIVAINRGSGARLPLTVTAVPITFDVGATHITVDATGIYPSADGTGLNGKGANRWSTTRAVSGIFDNLSLAGTTSGSVIVKAPPVAGSHTVTLPAGTTDFSATGGPSRFVKQGSPGGAFTVAQPAFSDIAGIATAAQGGTGLSTYAVGDLIYASATTPTLSRLAAAASGSVLASIGANKAPTWTNSPTLTKLTLENGITNGFAFKNANGNADAALSEGAGGSLVFTTGALNVYTVNDFSHNNLMIMSGPQASATLQVWGTLEMQTGKVAFKSFTVGTLPSGAARGETVYASNCRVFNGAGVQERTGAGSGALVSYNGSAWKIAGTNVTAVA
jgi:hypothetical protein